MVSFLLYLTLICLSQKLFKISLPLTSMTSHEPQSYPLMDFSINITVFLPAHNSFQLTFSSKQCNSKMSLTYIVNTHPPSEKKHTPTHGPEGMLEPDRLPSQTQNQASSTIGSSCLCQGQPVWLGTSLVHEGRIQCVLLFFHKLDFVMTVLGERSLFI